MKKMKKKTLIKLVAAAVAFLALLGICVYTVFIRPSCQAFLKMSQKNFNISPD